MYALERTLPSGEKRTQREIMSVRDAARAAGYVLADNGLAPSGVARRFAARLARTPIGETLTHTPSGYEFRIVGE